MTLPLRLDFPGLLPSGLNKLMRMPWQARGRERDAILIEVRCVLSQVPNPPSFPLPAPVRVVYTRRACKPMDPDNASSSVKHLLDAAVRCGILEDDSPEFIGELVSRQVRVPHKNEQGCTLAFEPMTP